MSLVSPDNTSDGQLMKKWKISEGNRVLIKGSSNPYQQEALCEVIASPYQQEALCEVIASKIAEKLEIDHVEYSIIWENDKLFSVCNDFINSETELISAYYVMKTMKKSNNISEYEFYIQCAENLGVKDVRSQTEKMLVLDFHQNLLRNFIVNR